MQVALVEIPEVRAVLHRVCCFYAMSNILDENWTGLGLIGPRQLVFVKETTREVHRNPLLARDNQR